MLEKFICFCINAYKTYEGDDSTKNFHCRTSEVIPKNGHDSIRLLKRMSFYDRFFMKKKLILISRHLFNQLLSEISELERLRGNN